MKEVDGQRDSLPHDVMIDILKRLPVKSLMRFKCLSRTWCDVIYSVDFISIHYNHDCLSNYFTLFKRFIKIDGNDSIYYGNNMLSFHSNDESFKTIASNIEYIDNYIGVSIVGPCNGIVYISSYRSTALYNPTLREFFELPPSILPHSPDLSPVIELNTCVIMTMGIGFDPNTNDYKVIRILIPFHEYEWEDTDNYYKLVSKVEVYNLSTNSWRKIEDLQCLVDPWRCFNVLINGAFHWRGTNLSPAGDNWIVSFNFSTELFQNILFPEGLDIEPCKSLVVLNESLALICYTNIFYPQNVVTCQSIDIWLMKKYGVRESWIKEFTVGPMVIETPLSVWMNDVELMIESNNGKLASCNLFCGEFKDLNMSGDPNTLEIVVCKESLISIKKEREKWS
ncbi:PREDICTED: F-box protein CPR30-like [Nicotiana attenuata]|uniref:F-box protein cpr30 n=1 Tax=Nicotiana attenuata TaxID=49451 RepID=A0A1J6JFK2_NICAT|nr:PREDICTED: F-box protein CPR30-like [Nicotiana attenuata]OIT08447.1 f-box protein cpr30 [Nicotiana attenuata]QCF41899.1 SLF-like-1 protein [Nicotiana attenuata]